MGVARTVYIRRASPMFSLLLLFMQPLVFYSEYQPRLRFLRFLRSCISISAVRPTLSISLSDTSVPHCPSLCSTRPSDIVRSCQTPPSDAVRRSVRHVRLTLSVLVRHVRLTLSVSVSRSRSRSHSRFRSIPVPVAVPPPLALQLPLASPELTRVPWRTAAVTQLHHKACATAPVWGHHSSSRIPK